MNYKQLTQLFPDKNKSKFFIKQGEPFSFRPDKTGVNYEYIRKSSFDARVR